MKRFGKVALGALMLAGAAALTATPASAGVDVGISFGWGGPGYMPFSNPCDYYDYYDEPPPWGLPPDYCEYPVYFEPVYYGGYWYRGPIYYRWSGGERLYWLNGGWRHDNWRGGRADIRWEDRGGWGRSSNWNRGYSGGHSYYGGSGSWSGGARDYRSGGGGNSYHRDNSGRNWSGGGHDNWSGGGSHNWSGGGGGHNWSGGGGGGHSWSGGGGGHSWSGGGGHSSGGGGHSGGGHSGGGGRGGHR
ncbi:MAG: hypothetical protein KGI68_01640 [Alphaproteobacteria bacterium]|nr:hypothetical protein [Alphaproteobacteria bacterium]MDE1986646.1 hypothetical protein [Alphaproteobacteria bacterium]MDE2164417.1 hypothetical protein [Alphaproteobacteria bacterium]MDE2265286.1 hypothetical protein [Alphaproteobacteria bacterium]MDE2499079.1 hypothetical protein [Alphaproteobacteria bacterium]